MLSPNLVPISCGKKPDLRFFFSQSIWFLFWNRNTYLFWFSTFKHRWTSASTFSQTNMNTWWHIYNILTTIPKILNLTLCIIKVKFSEKSKPSENHKNIFWNDVIKIVVSSSHQYLKVICEQLDRKLYLCLRREKSDKQYDDWNREDTRIIIATEKNI